MNVCLVSRHYPPVDRGGIAVYTRYMAQALRERGHRVWVLATGPRSTITQEEQAGIRVWRQPPVPRAYRLSRLPGVGAYHRFVGDVWHAWRVRRLLSQLCDSVELDVVEYSDIDAEGLFHPVDRWPYVVKLHTPHFVLRPFYNRREQPYDSRPVEWLERRFITRAAARTAPSHSMARLVETTYGLATGSIHYVPNPIDAGEFAPGPETSGQRNVLLPGRLEYLKGSDVFAQAIPIVARRCPDVAFVFLGSDRRSRSGGSMQAELRTDLASHGVDGRVQFVGNLPAEGFLRHYRQAAVVVIPSRLENCPYTLLEAMACARPVVATNAYGMAEMVEDGTTGRLFEPGNASALAEAVLALLNDPARAERMGQLARARVLQSYAPSIVAEATERVYRQVVASPRLPERPSKVRRPTPDVGTSPRLPKPPPGVAEPPESGLEKERP